LGALESMTAVLRKHKRLPPISLPATMEVPPKLPLTMVFPPIDPLWAKHGAELVWQRKFPPIVTLPLLPLLTSYPLISVQDRIVTLPPIDNSDVVNEITPTDAQ
jgi:hypothetical protein